MSIAVTAIYDNNMLCLGIQVQSYKVHKYNMRIILYKNSKRFEMLICFLESDIKRVFNFIIQISYLCCIHYLYCVHNRYVNNRLIIFKFSVHNVMFIIIFRYYQVNLFKVKLIDVPALYYMNIYTLYTF